MKTLCTNFHPSNAGTVRTTILELPYAGKRLEYIVLAPTYDGSAANINVTLVNVTNFPTATITFRDVNVMRYIPVGSILKGDERIIVTTPAPGNNYGYLISAISSD